MSNEARKNLRRSALDILKSMKPAHDQKKSTLRAERRRAKLTTQSLRDKTPEIQPLDLIERTRAQLLLLENERDAEIRRLRQDLVAARRSIVAVTEQRDVLVTKLRSSRAYARQLKNSQVSRDTSEIEVSNQSLHNSSVFNSGRNGTSL